MVDDSKRAILEAAKYLFAKNGYEGTSISHIAREAGAAKSLIYYYFSSKEEILSEILEEGTKDVYEIHQAMSDSGKELTEEFMMSIMETIANRFMDRQDVIRIMIQEFLKGTHKDNDIYEYADTFLDYIKKRSEKYFKDDDEEKMKFILELIFVGSMPFYLFLISGDFIADRYGFNKEKMWSLFKEIYRDDYIKILHKKLNNL